MTPRPILALALGSVVALAACTDPATLASTSDQNRTRDGAIMGSILGATAGVLTAGNSNKLKNAALGAAIGGGIGAAVGNGLDRQAAALRQSIGDDRVTVTNTGQNLVVTMPQDILFATNSAELQPALRSQLRAVAANLNQYPASSIDIIGHTDNTGDAAFNQELSSRRASSVAGVLISEGVASSRIRTIGRGEDAPIDTNLTEAGRAQNRRVEIVINPTQA